MRFDNQHFDMYISKQHETEQLKGITSSVPRYRCPGGDHCRIINCAIRKSLENHDNISNTNYITLIVVFAVLFVLLQSLLFL